MSATLLRRLIRISQILRLRFRFDRYRTPTRPQAAQPVSTGSLVRHGTPHASVVMRVLSGQYLSRSLRVQRSTQPHGTKPGNKLCPTNATPPTKYAAYTASSTRTCTDCSPQSLHFPKTKSNKYNAAALSDNEENCSRPVILPVSAPYSTGCPDTKGRRSYRQSSQLQPR